jgi:hypothetical protein
LIWRLPRQDVFFKHKELNFVNIYLSIDDTDNLDSPGSGHLSEIMAQELQHLGLVSRCSNISRHQLFVHQDIPYTSHNSSMCFSAVIEETGLAKVIDFAGEFLEKASAPGADPGLCVAAEGDFTERQSLIDFGLRAKKTLLTKQEAYCLARKAGVHLSEHGGTGDGIVGALAGIGLRMQGSDGRFRGWVRPGKAGEIVDQKTLCERFAADGVVDINGNNLREDTGIAILGKKIKTIRYNYSQVIPVISTGNTEGPAWRTLTETEVKRF